MINSKLVCFKCGGVGHKSNVRPSVDYVDYRKLKAPSRITADDEYVEVFCLGTSTSNIGCSLCIVLHMYWQIYLVLK